MPSATPVSLAARERLRDHQATAAKAVATHGAAVYARQSPGCITCHVVRGQGTDFGPNLSEIGSKLGKDALMEAILDPSAGISFGFEAFNLVLKNGDEAFGLITSETAGELSLKAVGGIVTKYQKNEIASRQQSKLSIMPVGLRSRSCESRQMKCAFPKSNE